MPELAEVEFYRRQWNCALKQKILAVELHVGKRIFRGTNTTLLSEKIKGALLLESRTHGKQMLFHLSPQAWLGIHLGMTGTLRFEKPDFPLLKHDHLALRTKNCTLIFSDPRQFGRVLFHIGKNEPPWWSKLPPEIFSPEFTESLVAAFLQRHSKAPVKAVLLMQNGFPGVGNWMADEILWQAGIHPTFAAGKLGPQKMKALWKFTRSISRDALRIIGKDLSDPPASWLFRFRWKKKGACPSCHAILEHATIGGRTTCFCPQCQKKAGAK